MTRFFPNGIATCSAAQLVPVDPIHMNRSYDFHDTGDAQMPLLYRISPSIGADTSSQAHRTLPFPRLHPVLIYGQSSHLHNLDIR